MIRGLIVFVVGMAVGQGGPTARGADIRDDRPTISVSGTGKVAVVPDLADVQAGVVTQAATAEVALAANTEAMTKLRAVLKGREIDPRKIQTTRFHVEPLYSQPPNPPGFDQGQSDRLRRIVGYRVTNSVRVTVRRNGTLGALLDAIVQGGANQVDGISFRVEEPSKHLDEARQNAYDDAKHKAELVARHAGMVLGPPLRIDVSEAGDGAPDFPMMMGMGMAGMGGGQAPVPVEAGEEEINVAVRVVFELKTPR